MASTVIHVTSIENGKITVWQGMGRAREGRDYLTGIPGTRGFQSEAEGRLVNAPFATLQLLSLHGLPQNTPPL